MNFPCPHCGSEESLSTRSPDDIKMIVPKEFQGDFDEPPPPVYSPGVSTSLTKGSSSITSSAQKQKKGSNGIENLPSSATYRSSAPGETIPETSFDNRLLDVEIAIKNMENDVKALSVDMKTLLKSQKVIESILTKINKELLKLREK